MLKQITYKRTPDNTRAVLDFIGPVPPCPICGDYGEYEGEYGPKGCNPCNSRLIPFINVDGQRDYLDWDETIEKDINGGLLKVNVIE